MANLPHVTSQIPPDLRQFITRVREVLDARGNGAQITRKDLIDIGLIDAGGSPVTTPGGGGSDVVDSPTAPTGFNAYGTLKAVFLEWDPAPYRGHSYTEVWRAATDNLGAAVMVAQVSGSLYADQASGLSYYWIRHVNRLAAAGPYNAVGGTAAGPGIIGNTDLGPLIVEAANLANGAVTAAKVATAALDATKFAASIEPVTIVVGATVPTTKSTSTIYLTGDSKLYRWNGTAYTAAVPTADLQGTITDAQIAGLAASKVTGQLSDAQLAAISAAKLTGQITSTQITDGAISTPKLAAGAVTAAQIAADTITAAQIAANAITSSELAAGAVVAGKIAAGTIVAADIAAGAITGDRIAANTIAADRLQANSITAGQIAAGAIGAAQIAAGAIRTDRLLVTGQGSALNADPNTQDVSAWTGGVFSVLADSTAPTGRALEISSTGATTIEVNRIPLEEGRNYLLRITARQVSGASSCYLGIEFTDAAGTVLTTGAGWPSIGSYHYFGLLSQQPPAAYTQYSIAFGPGETAKIPAGARFARLLVLGNYTGSGVQRFSAIRLSEKASADLIVDGAIIATKLAANAIAVGTAAIQNGAITNAMLGNAIIDSAKIVDAAVISAKIQDGAITTAKIGDAQITTAKIGTAQITNALIADAAITNAKIANLDASKINTGFLDAARIAASSITAAQIDTRNLTVRDASGNILLGAGTNLAASNITPAANWLNGNISLSATGVLVGAGGGQVQTLPVVDNVSERSTNRPPSWYPVGTTREFKVSAAVGLGGADNYLTLETVIQYSDSTGGACYQYAYRGTTTWRRWGTCGASSWAGPWVQDLDRNAYTGDLNAEANSRITIGPDGKITGIGSGSGSSVANDLISGGVRRVPHPGGGTLTSDLPTQAGCLWMILPTGFNYSMLRFDVEVFEYLTNSTQTYSISGYTYPDGNDVWINVGATYLGDPARVRPVTFGKDTATGRPMIAIGTFAGSWSYPKFKVSNLVVGYTGHADAAWANDWNLSFQTSRTYTEHSVIATPRPGGALSGADRINSGNVGNLVDVGAGLNNNQIGINASGQFYGGGAGTGTPVSNNQIMVDTNGRLTGIGTGAGALVDNTKVGGDNLIPDPQFLSPNFWMGGWDGDPSITTFAAINASRWTGNYAGSPGVALQCNGGGANADVTGQRIILQRGRYRLRIRVYESSPAGSFWAGLHVPNQAWWTAPPVNGGQQPTASIPENGWNFAAIPNNSWTDYVSVLDVVGSDSFVCQPRIRNMLTGGTIWLTMELARIPSFDGTNEIGGQITSGNASTYIANAAIGTAQIANAAIGLAQINTATITNLQAINAFTGQLTVDSTGHIKGGQTAFATGDGFFLGYSGGEASLSVGDSTAYLRYKPSTGLEIKLRGISPSLPAADVSIETAGTGTCSAEINFDSSGNIRSRTNGGSYVNQSRWYDPATGGVGSNFWIKFVRTSAAPPSGSATATTGWLSLSAGQSVVVSKNSTTGTASGTYQVSLSNSATGTPVVSSGVIYLEATRSP